VNRYTDMIMHVPILYRYMIIYIHIYMYHMKYMIIYEIYMTIYDYV